MKFEKLANSIKSINDKAGSTAKSAVNQLMTLRNWAIGYYIVEYEQAGSDRAEYGAQLLKNLEKEISQKGMNSTLFKLCRNFYLLYPQIGATVSNQFELPELKKSSTVSHQFETKPEVLVSNLSFSHIREIMVIEDAFERFFYETECMKCNWSVRELRRQIKTNLFVRAGISKHEIERCERCPYLVRYIGERISKLDLLATDPLSLLPEHHRHLGNLIFQYA